MAEIFAVFRGPAECKLVMQRVLREIMASDKVDERYRYKKPKHPKDTPEREKEEEQAKIRIYRAHPGRLVHYPCITITSGAHLLEIMAFGEEGEVASEHFDKITGVFTSITRTGYTRIPIEIKIWALKSDDRDNLSSFLGYILRVLQFNTFVDFGWNKIQMSGDTQTMLNAQEVLYNYSMTVMCHTDYTHIDIIDPLDIIKACTVNVIPVLQFSEDIP